MPTKTTISQSVEKRLRGIASSMGGKVEVGFLEGSTEPGGMSTPTVAYLNEFGHGGRFPSPPRPFFRPMVKKESPTWGKKVAGLAKAYDYDGGKVLAVMGEDITGALVDSIRSVNEPALSDTTLALRAKFGNNPQNITLGDVLEARQAVEDGTATLASGKQAKPLEWTGSMVRAANYKVMK